MSKLSDGFFRGKGLDLDGDEFLREFSLQHPNLFEALSGMLQSSDGCTLSACRLSIFFQRGRLRACLRPDGEMKALYFDLDLSQPGFKSIETVLEKGEFDVVEYDQD